MAQQPLRVSADAMTLTGGALRLTGHAKVNFDGTTVSADEAVIDGRTSEVDLTGHVNALLGSAVRERLGLSVPIREFR